MTNPTGLDRAERLAFSAAPTREEIHDLVEDRLVRVEETFRANLASPVSIVSEIGEFVAHSGGKRVRPTLHLLAARLCRYDGPNDVLLATVLEFIHCATLIHDDIIDEAITRRGRDSVNRRWGNNVTVLFGDYLFAKAMEMALQAESLEVMDELARVTLRMTEGEMLQTRYAGRIDLTVEEYLDLVEKKTAALFACCCELAGILAGESAEGRRALRSYGMNLGLAFQLVDDLLDFTGSSEVLGKPAANDLREGKATLAVIDLIASGDTEGRSLAEEIMAGADPDGPAGVRLGQKLKESGALDRTHDRAQNFARRALDELRPFDEGPAKKALIGLSDLLLHRSR